MLHVIGQCVEFVTRVNLSTYIKASQKKPSMSPVYIQVRLESVGQTLYQQQKQWMLIVTVCRDRAATSMASAIQVIA